MLTLCRSFQCCTVSRDTFFWNGWLSLYALWSYRTGVCSQFTSGFRADISQCVTSLSGVQDSHGPWPRGSSHCKFSRLSLLTIALSRFVPKAWHFLPFIACFTGEFQYSIYFKIRTTKSCTFTLGWSRSQPAVMRPVYWVGYAFSLPLTPTFLVTYCSMTTSKGDVVTVQSVDTLQLFLTVINVTAIILIFELQ